MQRLENPPGGWSALSGLVDQDWGPALLALLRLLTLAALCAVYLAKRRRSLAFKTWIAQLEKRAREERLPLVGAPALRRFPARATRRGAVGPAGS